MEAWRQAMAARRVGAGAAVGGGARILEREVETAIVDYIGFRRLRAGRIHLYCPQCGRKQSNARRSEEDPVTATLMEVLCERCDAGNKDSGVTYRNRLGKVVEWWQP